MYPCYITTITLPAAAAAACWLRALQEAGVAGEGEAAPEQQARGLGSWLQSKLEGKAGLVMDKVRDTSSSSSSSNTAVNMLITMLEGKAGKVMDKVRGQAAAAAAAAELLLPGSKSAQWHSLLCSLVQQQQQQQYSCKHDNNHADCGSKRAYDGTACWFHVFSSCSSSGPAWCLLAAVGSAQHACTRLMLCFSLCLCVCLQVLAAALDALDGPLQEVIGRLVDELESSSTAAAFQQVRQKLAEYKLISAA
jgi:hypothetical protein